METEIVTSTVRYGNMETITKELREKTRPKVISNKNGKKVWETKIGKTIKIISKKIQEVAKR